MTSPEKPEENKLSKSIILNETDNPEVETELNVTFDPPKRSPPKLGQNRKTTPKKKTPKKDKASRKEGNRTGESPELSTSKRQKMIDKMDAQGLQALMRAAKGKT